jgi:seryl-tRNA synthetase
VESAGGERFAARLRQSGGRVSHLPSTAEKTRANSARVMLDLRYVVDHLEEVRAALARRGPQWGVVLDEIAKLRTERSAAITARDTKIHAQKSANEAMAKAPKGGPEFAAKREELKALSGEIKSLEAETSAIEAKLEDLLLGVPNLPDAGVPTGTGEADNVVVRTWGEKPTTVGDAPKDHVDVGTRLGILDFEKASKISGARFGVLVGLGARLERALAAFMLDLHTRQHGYTEVMPPVLIKGECLRTTGQLPKFESDLFKTHKRETEKGEGEVLYLSPTSEVQLCNLHADEILDESKLPIKYTAHTSCFRSEAGSYGKDTRGLIRNHQFQKVELVQITTAEQSVQALEELTGHAEKVLQKLGLHYRVMKLCTADLGFGSRTTYDLEVWLPGQHSRGDASGAPGAYREISSCSNMGDFQARRGKIRARVGKDKPRLVHTLNGSGLAVGRTLVAILEQCQRPDGSVVVPEALRAFMGVDVIAPPA